MKLTSKPSDSSSTSSTSSTLDAPTFIDSRLGQAQSYNENFWLVNGQFCDSFSHWSYSRVVAMSTAGALGLLVASVSVSQEPKGLLVPKVFSSDVEDEVKTLHNDAHKGFVQQGLAMRFEQEGGPGIKECIDFVDQNSSMPIVDVQMLLKWIIISYLLGHTEQNAAHVMLRGSNINGWRLAPFSWMTTFPEVASSMPYVLCKGMRVGNNWPDDFIMAHQLISLAGWARVKPKIVFTMAKSLAQKLPETFKSALNSQYKTTTNSTASRLYQCACVRAQRLKEVCLSAPMQGVAGLKKIR